MQDIIRDLLIKIGEDPDREGLKKTPERFEKSITFLTQGYRQDPREVLRSAIFHEQYDEMVTVKDIDIFSMCEHHMLPFFGKCHVAYMPRKNIVGLSKIARVVELYARRLQVQERLTQEIATALMDTLQPHGVAVVVEAFHLCMMMRGVEKQNAKAVTSAMLGVFRTRESTRMEFLELIKPNLNIVRSAVGGHSTFPRIHPAAGSRHGERMNGPALRGTPPVLTRRPPGNRSRSPERRTAREDAAGGAAPGRAPLRGEEGDPHLHRAAAARGARLFLLLLGQPLVRLVLLTARFAQILVERHRSSPYLSGTPNLIRIFSIRHQFVHPDWNRLSPTNTVNSRNQGETYHPSPRLTSTKVPAITRIHRSTFIATPPFPLPVGCSRESSVAEYKCICDANHGK